MRLHQLTSTIWFDHSLILYKYYEWKINDISQLRNIKNAVPAQSFNHHFKLHKLDWFLKVYKIYDTQLTFT